jgi:hypothetical protein
MAAAKIFRVGVSMLSMCVPIYIAKLSPEHTHGMLETMWQVAFTSGIASGANMGLKSWINGWRLSHDGDILFVILLLIYIMFILESLNWLVAQSIDDHLDQALRKRVS